MLDYPFIANEMRDRLTEWEKQNITPRLPKPQPVFPLDPATTQELKALGYIE